MWWYYWPLPYFCAILLSTWVGWYSTFFFWFYARWYFDNGESNKKRWNNWLRSKEGYYKWLRWKRRYGSIIKSYLGEDKLKERSSKEEWECSDKELFSYVKEGEKMIQSIISQNLNKNDNDEIS
jgi:hypothetical protein